MMTTFKWDYHLARMEQRSVNKKVPSSQMKVQLACRANFWLNKERHRAGVVALTEHYLVFFTKRFVRGGFNHCKNLHMLDVIGCESRDDNSFTVTTREVVILIESPVAMRLCRNFIKSYVMITKNVFTDNRMSVKLHTMKYFPRFDPKVSPSQAFQFALNGYASWLDIPYKHEIVQYYHKLMLNGVCVFDLNKLPLSFVSSQFDDALNIEAVMSSLMGDRFIHVIKCYDIERPDLLKAMASLLGGTRDVHAVMLRNCGITGGVVEAVRAMKSNRHLDVNFWDLAGNEFENLMPFMEMLKDYQCGLTYLNLNNTNMSRPAVQKLISAISENENLWTLVYLGLLGFHMTDRIGNSLAEVIKARSVALRFIELEGPGIPVILKALLEMRVKMERITIRKTEMTDEITGLIVSMIKGADGLRHLDISYTEATTAQMNDIIDAINMNTDIRDVMLVLDGLTIEFETACKLGFQPDGKWDGFSLKEVTFGAGALEATMDSISRLSYLGSVRLDGNVASVLERISFLPIAKVTISNCKDVMLLLDNMSSNTELRSLRLEHCGPGRHAYTTLADAVPKLSSLQEIHIDDCRPSSLMPIKKLLEAVKESTSIVTASVGLDDMVRLAVADEEGGTDIVDAYCRLETPINDICTSNGYSIGIRHSLEDLGVPEFYMLLEGLVSQTRERAVETPIHVHSGYTSIIRLPLPFQEPGQQVEDMEKMNVEKALGKQITEEVMAIEAGFQTLQFNSLMVNRDRRPSEEVDDAIALSPLMVPADMEEEEED